MKKILLIIMTVCATQVCFAEKLQWKPLSEVESPGEFGTFPGSTPGFHLGAYDGSNVVALRLNGFNVCCQIFIKNKLESGSLYLRLLDDDGYLVKSIFISRLANGFYGKLDAEFTLTSSEINKFKAFGFGFTE